MKRALCAISSVPSEIDWRLYEGIATVSIVSGSMISGESASSGMGKLETPLTLR